MMRLLFRLLALAGAVFTLCLLLAIAAAGYVVFAGPGSPPPCADESDGPLDTATHSLAFDVKLAISSPPAAAAAQA
jgi:hypothetical protein